MIRTATILTSFVILTDPGSTDDWPMWRGDVRRSATSDSSLPDQLQLHWTRELADALPSTILSLEARTGKEVWSMVKKESGGRHENFTLHESAHA